MSGKRGEWSLLLVIALLLPAAAAWAEQTVSYRVSGPMGAAMGGLGAEEDTEALVLAFSHVMPIPPKPAAAATEPAEPLETGPRLVFFITRWVQEGGEWVQCQWYGDAPLEPKALVILPGMAGGTLEATVTGTLEESRESGAVVRREVNGRLQVRWTAAGRPADTTLAYAYQTPAYGLILQTSGVGRTAKATATVTVEELGPPIKIDGPGSLAEVAVGLLTVKLR